MATISVLIEQLFILVAHAISGIYSSNLKYSKKRPLLFGAFGLCYRDVFGVSENF